MTLETSTISEPDTNTSLDGLEHLLPSSAAPAGEESSLAVAQAVIYLRVSTPRQLHTGPIDVKWR